MQIDESLLYVGHEASPLPNERPCFLGWLRLWRGIVESLSPLVELGGIR